MSMYRVLVADDEPIERNVVSRTIQKYFDGQLTVVTAACGREAVERFEEQRCEIVLLDIGMPGMNGLEAAEKIRGMDAACSIIFLTAFDEFSYAKRAISIRALDYLLKPGVDEELVAAIDEAIRRAAERREPQQNVHAVWDGETEDAAGNVRMTAVAEKMREYVENHYMEEIALQDAAAAMRYSEAYFCKIFKQCFDRSFVMYLTEYRMEKAKELLADVRMNVRDVGMQVGYHDSNYFAKVFKRIAGITPTEYRTQTLAKEKAGGEQDE